MSTTTFNSINDIYLKFPDDEHCQRYLEQLRWPDNVISPFHPFSQVYRCKDHFYKCRKSGKYFNVRTGTLFHNSKVPLNKWFAAFWIVGKRGAAITSVALAAELEITQKTAWYLLKRIKETGITSFESATSGSEQRHPELTTSTHITDWLRSLKKI